MPKAISQARKIWFITGIARGFGKELAKAAAADGEWSSTSSMLVRAHN